MNDHKFAFIICTNNEMLLNECHLYLSRLRIPDGYEVDIIDITEAASMTLGYNEGISSTDAMYKIYMHQDVFLIYPDFLQSVLDIFSSNEKIGMIGLIGYPRVSPFGVMWSENRVGSVPLYGIGNRYGKIDFNDYRFDIEKDLNHVAIIDGLCMITKADVAWDTSFDKWDFYDASHSLDMRLAGYEVVVPTQTLPWFIHDDGRILTLYNYNTYRKLFIEKYKGFLGKYWNEINDIIESEKR